MQVKVLHNQSFQDIAIEHTGTVTNAVAIAFANNYAPSVELIPGTEITIPELNQVKEIYAYFQSKKLHPATAQTIEGALPLLKGIGYMQIGSTFKVS